MRMRRGRSASGKTAVAFEAGRNSMVQTGDLQTAVELPPEAAIAGLSLARPASAGPYRAYVAATDEERRSAYRLRFRVFNVELNEGLDSAFVTGQDQDEFDVVCDHVIVEDRRTGAVVGTYRLQTGVTAARHLGYYSAREFDFSPYEYMRAQMVELGRACIHPDHRRYEV